MKKFKEFIAEAKDKDIDYGWSIITPDERTIEENAQDGGFKELSEDNWKEITKDIQTIERNCLNLLKKWGVSASDEGHDKDGALVGTIWVKKGSKEEEKIKDNIDGDEPEPINSFFKESDVWKGTSKMAEFVSVDIQFWK